MSRSDDLGPLFSSGSPEVGFAQGTVVSWDSADGTNVVNVKGTNLTDLPALNIGDFTILQEGDVVGLLRFQSTYFILGRIVLPAPPDDSRAVIDFFTATYQNLGFGVTVAPDETTVASGPARTPSWTREGDEVTILATLTVTAQNQTATDDWLYASIRIPEVDMTSGKPFTAVQAGFYGLAAIATTETFSALHAGVHDYDVVGQANTAGAVWPSEVQNYAQLQVLTFTRRTQ